MWYCVRRGFIAKYFVFPFSFPVYSRSLVLSLELLLLNVKEVLLNEREWRLLPSLVVS